MGAQKCYVTADDLQLSAESSGHTHTTHSGAGPIAPDPLIFIKGIKLRCQALRRMILEKLAITADLKWSESSSEASEREETSVLEETAPSDRSGEPDRIWF